MSNTLSKSDAFNMRKIEDSMDMRRRALEHAFGLRSVGRGRDETLDQTLETAGTVYEWLMKPYDSLFPATDNDKPMD